MKRHTTRSKLGLSHEAQQLIRLAQGLADSGSLAEDRFWTVQLTQSIDKLLATQQENILHSVLDRIYDEPQTHAYEALADILEARAESGSPADEENETLLIAAPVLLWSRFNILTNLLTSTWLAQIRNHLRSHIFADKVRISIANVLFSPDQLPQGYCATAQLAYRLAQAAKCDEDSLIDASTLSEAPHYLSDVRYLLLCIVAEHDAPIFRWQTSLTSRADISAAWVELTHDLFQQALPGCRLEVLPPDAYFAASRLADRLSRPYAIRASVEFLTSTFVIQVHQLRAYIALFKDKDSAEYRIGFALDADPTIAHGVVWPLLGLEEESGEIVEEIQTTLKECGLTHINFSDNVFPPEYCGDCNAPLYPTQDGELSHAELPEDMENPLSQLLH